MSDVVPFIEAEPGQHAYTYRPDPSGEFGWVTDPEWFDDIDDPVTVTRQRWQLVATEQVTFHPSTELCPECHGDGTVIGEVWRADGHGGGAVAKVDVDCPLCKGDGRHPLHGEMEVLP